VSEPYDRVAWEREGDVPEFHRDGLGDAGPAADVSRDQDLDEARENVFDGWPSSEDVSQFVAQVRRGEVAEKPEPDEPVGALPSAPLTSPAEEPAEADPALESPAVPDAAEEDVAEDKEEEVEPRAPAGETQIATEPTAPAVGEHAPGELDVPSGYNVLAGEPDGARRAVGVVVSRFNGDVTSRMLSSALEELEQAGVLHDAITVMPVPGAFELPIGAMALARTRRFACIVALGCVIRGETPHFDYVASEAASGLQLAALETGVPVSFGVLTLERADQADARVDKGAEAVRTALEMADLFAHLRAAAAR
jgi:6,7-dimethyl-8-ribityllumazine synthase